MTSTEVRILRNTLGWSQGELAHYLGVNQSAISRMESKQSPRGPTLKLLEILAEKVASGEIGELAQEPAE